VNPGAAKQKDTEGNVRNAASMAAGLSVLLFFGSPGRAQSGTTVPAKSDLHYSPIPLRTLLNCDEVNSGFCAELAKRTNYEGKYIGHDEPSLLFYSNVLGSGNNTTYYLVLPTDPPTPPAQDGTGGTFNFQLSPAFWFGMAMCDTQSFPNFTHICVPNSDTNIFDNPDPTAPDTIDHHPGTAFLELQFYPPGWIGTPELIDAFAWFAALNIDSLGESVTSLNNKDCQEKVGSETVNFAVITHNGIPLFPANPLGANFGVSRPDLNNVLKMFPGDLLVVNIRDTATGVRVMIKDLTDGQSGVMAARPRSGFGQVIFDPDAKRCSVKPYAFHPIYSTSSEHTRVPWLAHSFNIAFSDEIGHFEFCDASDPNTFACTSPGVPDNTNGDGLDPDDQKCSSPTDFGLSPPFVPIRGCIETEVDFDGVSYGLNWPGTDPDPSSDFLNHPAPLHFTSPIFKGPGGLANYERVGFETDLPRIESYCDLQGKGCSNPPRGGNKQQAGKAFYPIYTTTEIDSGCWWQLGGNLIPGTVKDFGGTSTAEYGTLLKLHYPGGFSAVSDYRRILSHNPCPGPAPTR
jgi:hypothetical protein